MILCVISLYKSAMSDTENKATNESAEVKEKPNHIAGCSIFLVILLTVAFVITMAFWTYFDYKNAVVDITEEKAVPTQVADTEDKSATAALDKKFGEFSELVKAKKPATLTLSIDEINLAIAHFEKLDEFKGKLFVTGLESSEGNKKDLIVTRASFTMKPGLNPERYMNGEVKFRPEIAEGSIFPIIEEADPDTGKPIPPKMMQALSTLMFTEYRNDDSIKDVFHRINTAKVIDNQLVITSDPDDQVVAIKDREITSDRKAEVFQMIGLVAFIFITSILFAIWYRKFKKKQKGNE